MSSAGAASIPSSADYKKALKTLEGEKRATLKKAKSLKGSKGKEAIAQIEEEFTIKFQQLLEQYTTTTTSSNKEEEPVAEPEPTTGTTTSGVDTTTTNSTSSQQPPDHTDNDDEEEAERQRKLLKVQRKKEKQRQKERERHEQELQAEAEALAGPNMKQQEWDQIQTHLQPLQLTVKQVVADGHCLYRSVGAQTGHDYTQIRSLCADTLASHPDDFAPFCEYTDDNEKDDNPYQAYVAKVRYSAEWGGHLELRALALALNRPILVYQAHSSVPLEITSSSPSSSDNWVEPIRLSYHRHYYALGEHYNQVVVAVKETENASGE